MNEMGPREVVPKLLQRQHKKAGVYRFLFCKVVKIERLALHGYIFQPNYSVHMNVLPQSKSSGSEDSKNTYFIAVGQVLVPYMCK